MARVLFCQEIYFPFESTARLSAFLKRSGHQVDLVIGSSSRIVAHVRKTRPDLIAFSVLTPYRQHMLETVHEIKRAGIRDIPVIAGGYDVTFTPEILEFSELDIICLGEGEEPLAELCSKIDAGQDHTGIPNLWVKKGGKIFKNPMRPWADDLDRLPFEDRDLYHQYGAYFRTTPFEQVLAGRGCPYACHYCFNPEYKKLYEAAGSTGYCRLRSVPNLIKELLVLKEKYGARTIVFQDSTFTYPKAWLFEFLKQHREKVRIPFIINAVISEIDEETGRALAENGYCKLIKFGLETGNERFRNEVLGKKITNEQLFRGAAILRKHGLRYSIHMMLGLPGETLALAWETLEMARALSARDTIHAVNLFEPFPGLAITEYGVRSGHCKEKSPAGAWADAFRKRTEGRSCPVVFYEVFRSDPEGRQILKLSRFSYLLIRFPWLRPLIEKLIRWPDNALFRLVWDVTRVAWHVRLHYGASFFLFIRYRISPRR